jgi:hypothetical protein
MRASIGFAIWAGVGCARFPKYLKAIVLLIPGVDACQHWSVIGAGVGCARFSDLETARRSDYGFMNNALHISLRTQSRPL